MLRRDRKWPTSEGSMEKELFLFVTEDVEEFTVEQETAKKSVPGEREQEISRQLPICRPRLLQSGKERGQRGVGTRLKHLCLPCMVNVRERCGIEGQRDEVCTSCYLKSNS
ncbi:hypothetical protein EYF80_007718 [Liparis tanakae]|uniref:Uncharacterized protein n=1 Tax=Liparis tanakae TaxID=230148 RepID=A0A4Z2IXQ8_9TELE|nr:hypothetical protein EYF80_007718 [Liparis tanakae]